MPKDPEQIARDNIDSALWRSGWVIQDKDKINLNVHLPDGQATLGVVVRYYLIQNGKETKILDSSHKCSFRKQYSDKI